MTENEYTDFIAGPTETLSSGPMARDVRIWAEVYGVPCPDRGEIPQKVMDRYLEYLTAIRIWAGANGLRCPDFGEIPPEVMNQYLEHQAAIRIWAEANGKPCPDRGEIPPELMELYLQAHS